MFVGRMVDTNCLRCFVVNFAVVVIHEVTTGLFALLLSAVSVVLRCKLRSAGLPLSVKKSGGLCMPNLVGENYSRDRRLFSRDVHCLGSVVASCGCDSELLRCSLILERYEGHGLLAVSL